MLRTNPNPSSIPHTMCNRTIQRISIAGWRRRMLSLRACFSRSTIQRARRILMISRRRRARWSWVCAIVITSLSARFLIHSCNFWNKTASSRRTASIAGSCFSIRMRNNMIRRSTNRTQAPPTFSSATWTSRAPATRSRARQKRPTQITSIWMQIIIWSTPTAIRSWRASSSSGKIRRRSSLIRAGAT